MENDSEVDDIQIVLPIRALSLNTICRITRDGHYYTNPKVIEYKEVIYGLIRNYQQIKGPVHVDYTFSFKGKRNVDLDNCLKILNDAIKNYLLEDDAMIMSITAKKKMNCVSDQIYLHISKVV